MKQVRIGKHTLEVYDSIEELLMNRYHKFSKMLLIDAGIGSEIADFDKHIEKAIAFIRTSKDELAEQELKNLRQMVFFAQSEISLKSLAYAALINKIDGKATDISDEGLERTRKALSDCTYKDITSSVDEVKKKIDYELHTYFPDVFEDAALKEYHDQLKRRTLCVLEGIINGETDERTNEINRLTNYLLTFERPHEFEGKDNIEILFDKQFEKMCVLIASQLHINPKKCTVMEYYNAYEYIKEQNKRSKTRNRA